MFLYNTSVDNPNNVISRSWQDYLWQRLANCTTTCISGSPSDSHKRHYWRRLIWRNPLTSLMLSMKIFQLVRHKIHQLYSVSVMTSLPIYTASHIQVPLSSFSVRNEYMIQILIKNLINICCQSVCRSMWVKYRSFLAPGGGGEVLVFEDAPS